MHHGKDGRPDVRARRVGALLRRDGARALAERRWPVGGGAAIDHLVRSHAAYERAVAEAQDANMGVLDYLEARIASCFGDLSHAATLAADRHILPEFLGNRSPHADPDARAAIIGASLDDTVADLEVQFVAGLCGLAYGLAEVIEVLAANGVVADEIVASGGASHSSLVRQLLADATGLRVTLPETPEPVLLGAAMLGAVAAGAYASFEAAMAAVSRDGIVTEPAPVDIGDFHFRKRACTECFDKWRAKREPLWRRPATEVSSSGIRGSPGFVPVGALPKVPNRRRDLPAVIGNSLPRGNYHLPANALASGRG